MKKNYDQPWLRALFAEMPDICTISNDEGQDILPGEGGTNFDDI